MPFSRPTKKKLRESGRFECCELCGSKTPRLDNKGLQATHIVSENQGGPDNPDNAIILCNSCAETFDRLLKAVIAKAFMCCNSNSYTKYKAPSDWYKAEGRRAKKDNI
jgi:hypothetical protein